MKMLWYVMLCHVMKAATMVAPEANNAPVFLLHIFWETPQAQYPLEQLRAKDACRVMRRVRRGGDGQNGRCVYEMEWSGLYTKKRSALPAVFTTTPCTPSCLSACMSKLPACLPACLPGDLPKSSNRKMSK